MIQRILFFILTFASISQAHANDLPLEVQARINELTPYLSLSIETTEPYGSATTTQTSPFRNSIDWHSSVHAHWALLSMARLSKDESLREYVLDRLTIQRLKSEGDFLKKHPHFEMPYGQSWFHLLLSELQKTSDVYRTGVVETLRQEAEARIVRWLKSEPANCNGQYNSWVFAFFLLTKANPKSLWDDFYLKLKPLDCRQVEITGSDFLFPVGLQSILEGAISDRERFYAVPPSFDWNHTWGLSLSSVWNHAVNGYLGNQKSQETFDTQCDAFMRKSHIWGRSFVGFHWLPQFLWFGTWLNLGSP